MPVEMPSAVTVVGICCDVIEDTPENVGGGKLNVFVGCSLSFDKIIAGDRFSLKFQK